ncbi:MAG: hypothetical protein ACXVA9_01610 [Bdellovibrionales bacterium]
MNAAKILTIAILTWTCGCASVTPEPSRGPANVSPGGLNDEETAACDGSDCKYFIAPCSLKEHSPLYRAPGSTTKAPYMSLKDEAYLNELEDLAQRGFCQMAPRAMPAEQYNHDTCIYVFIKKDQCLPAN